MTSTTIPPFEGEAPEDVHRGQARMAYRLARTHADKLMHVHGMGWHHYNGTRWVVDHKGEAKRAVLEVLRSAHAEAFGNHEMLADIRKCETASGVNGVLDIASALEEFAFTVDDLDPDPNLLNVANGVLDLTTRALHPHSPDDRMTKCARGAYLPDADKGVWNGFLKTVLPDIDVRDYFQRVIGQGVHGAVTEHLFPVLIGTGANGKGTAYGAITEALGDYATIVNPDMLMAGGKGVSGPEMMVLRGARLVVGSETEEGRKLDEATMKRLTGGDELTARNLYSPPVTWKPSHQLLYVTNALPVVKGDDPAVWRRVRIIPFDVVVPPERRDPQLPDKLRGQADAILTWAVEGLFQYNAIGGMDEPPSVLRATDGYRSESDPVARFVADECDTNPHVHATTRELFNAWESWRHRDGAEQISEKAFSGHLQRLGYESGRTKAGTTWRGIRPIQQTDESGVW